MKSAIAMTLAIVLSVACAPSRGAESADAMTKTYKRAPAGAIQVKLLRSTVKSSFPGPLQTAVMHGIGSEGSVFRSPSLASSPGLLAFGLLLANEIGQRQITRRDRIGHDTGQPAGSHLAEVGSVDEQVVLVRHRCIVLD